MAFYSVYNELIQEVRTDFAYYTDKSELKNAFEFYFKMSRDMTEPHTLWGAHGFKIIEIPLDFIEKTDRKHIATILEGKATKNVEKGFEALDSIKNWQDDIKYILEVKECGFAAAWYIISSQTLGIFTIGYKRHDGMAFWLMNRGYREELAHLMHTMSYQTIRKVAGLNGATK